MKQMIGLRILSDIMEWKEDRSRKEFAWLQLMSRLKYDGYRDFVAGMRFIESLADWLQQFEQAERQAAYDFVRNHLVYIGPGEIQHLVEIFYPEHVQKRLLKDVARNLGIKTYQVWANPDAAAGFKRMLRKCLFFGLSDGARIETFRRTNSANISNEQVLLATEISNDKWKQLLEDLRDNLKDTSARFVFAFLLDDFVGTGTTLLRDEDGIWKGRLPRFWKAVEPFLDSHFEPDWVLGVHHYIATESASSAIDDRNQLITKYEGTNKWFANVEFSFGTILPASLRLDDEHYPSFMRLVKKYYSTSIQTKHTAKGGGSDVRLGFGQCALPFVLEHNTPNNSVALLWADTDGSDGQHAMRPLFRRRQRHS
jgi:hypothetical protein